MRQARMLALLLATLLWAAGCASAAPPVPTAPGAPSRAAPAVADAAPRAEAAPAAPSPVKVGRAGVTAGSAPLWIAHELGYFTKHGLTMEETQLRSSGAVQAALVSREIQIGSDGLAAALAARAGGGEPLLLAAFLDQAMGELIVRGDIREPAELRGRTLGVQSIGGTIHVRGLLALQRLGLNVERDQITVLQAGDDPTLAQALIAGAIDAAPLSYASAGVARANGMNGWDYADLGVPDSSASVITTHALAREQPALMEQFLKGLAEGVHFLQQGRTDPGKRTRALEIVAQRLQITPEALAPQLDKMAAAVRVNLTPNLANLTEFRAMTVELTPAVEHVTLDEVVDLQFVQKLEREGFFAGLVATP